jgi:hypothetical protein
MYDEILCRDSEMLYQRTSKHMELSRIKPNSNRGKLAQACAYRGIVWPAAGDRVVSRGAFTRKFRCFRLARGDK